MTWLKRKLKNTIVVASLVACSGCAEVITNVAVQGGVQAMGEQMLIANDKPVTRCNIINVAKGNKMCRIYRQYRRV
jgi:hypothetical protein